MFQKEVVEKVKIQIIMFFNFSENLASCDSIEKCGAALLVIHDHIMLHQKVSLGMPDKKGKNTDTHIICYTH